MQTRCRPIAREANRAWRDHASGDGKEILAIETDGGFDGPELFCRPVVRANCNRQPLNPGNHGVLGLGRKNAETGGAVGGGRGLCEPVRDAKTLYFTNLIAAE